MKMGDLNRGQIGRKIEEERGMKEREKEQNSYVRTMGPPHPCGPKLMSKKIWPHYMTHLFH